MILTTLSLAFFLLQVTPEVRQHVDAGLAAQSRGDLDTAAQEFQRVADLLPSFAAAHANLGAVYYEKKDFAKAIPSLRKALDLNADLPGTRAMLGAALLAQGYAAAAIPYLSSDDLLGIALLEAGREREAADKFEAALLQRPNDADLLYYLSVAYSALSNQLAQRLLVEQPASARAQQLLGEANAAAGKRAEAEKHFREALAARSDLRVIHQALGDLYLAGGDYANAEKEFRQEVALTPGSATAAYKLGSVLFAKGDAKAAAAELSRADELEPNSPETLLALGKAAAALGDSTRAETLFRKVVEQSPGLASAAHFQLAQIYRKLGRGEEARQEMRMFEKLRKPQ